MNRRRFLAISGGGFSTVGLAGCSFLHNSPVELGSVVVMNHLEDSKVVEVAIVENSEESYSTAVEVAPREDLGGGYRLGQEELECGWSSDQGQFRVRARLEGSDWADFDVSEEADGDCHFVGIEVGHPFSDGIRFQLEDCDRFSDDSDFGCE